MASAADTVLHRRLSGAQLEKRIRIVQSGIELARERGYDGFSTRDVAKRADVALGTIYNNFTSKDHLLAEALLEWLAEFDEQLSRQPIRGRTVATRLIELYERMAIRASSEPELYEALRRAMMSSDGSVESARRAHMEGARRWFELAIGSGPVGDADTLIEVLEYLFVGAFLMTPGSDDPKPLIDRLERSVRFIASRV
jgi:AcrR family transcriptional regulator